MYNDVTAKIPCRRLCRAHPTFISFARTARSFTTNLTRARPSHREYALRTMHCPICLSRGALNATVGARSVRQGSRSASAGCMRWCYRVQWVGSRVRLAGCARRAPVLLGHVFVVMGNAEHESLARRGAILSESMPAQVQTVARGEDMRRISGNHSGLIYGFAHGERPGTKTGTRAVPANLSLPPSLEERAMGESLQKSLRAALLDGVSGSWRFRQGVAARCHASQ